MSSDRHFEQNIKKALAQKIEGYPLPDFDRLWQRIETSIELIERQQRWYKRKLLKFSASAVLILAIGIGIWGAIHPGETSLFAYPFQQLTKIVTDNGDTLIQYSYEAGESSPADVKMDRSLELPSTMQDETEAAEAQLFVTNLTTTTLEELKDLYGGEIYLPQDLPPEDLEEVKYLTTGDLWTIIIDYKGEDYDLLFSQRELGQVSSTGAAYPRDTGVTVQRLDGVEYLVAEGRYGITNIRWIKENKEFEITVNKSPEDALKIASSTRPLAVD